MKVILLVFSQAEDLADSVQWSSIDVLAGRLELERPLVAFDLETTGVSRIKDRIVEFGAIKVFPNGR